MPKGRKASTRQARYAKARGGGMTQKKAAIFAGYAPNRARITGSELEKLATVQALMAKEIEVDAGRLQRLLGAQALGDAPTKIVRGKEARVEYDTHAARQTLARVHGLFRDRVEHSGPDGSPIQHELANLPDDELRRRLDADLKAIGGQAGE